MLGVSTSTSSIPGLADVAVSNTISACESCGSSNLIELMAETCLHFPRLPGGKVPPIFVFPSTVVCMDCGFMQSKLSWLELEQIKNGAVTIGAAT